MAVNARAGTASAWMLYDPSEVKVLMPRASDTRAAQIRELLPEQSALRKADARVTGGTVASRPGGNGFGMTRPPTAYVVTAAAVGVPAWLLFGVALQESLLAFGRNTLPYPWTLCVRGRGERHASYEQTLAALRRHVGRGISNVDCGAMQVNWGAHSDKLGSFENALDPYPNLRVGATILRGHYVATGNWHRAIGLYHTGSTGTPERRQRARTYADNVLGRLQRNGVDLRKAVSVSEARHA